MVDSRRIGTIIGRLIAGITAQLVNQFAFELRLNRVRIAGVTAQLLSSSSKLILLLKLTQFSTNLIVEVYKCQGKACITQYQQ